MTIANKREQIRQSLNDREYRHQYVDEEINVGIAFQIRSLRDRQKLLQEDLAKLLGVKQPLVSAWENPNYGKYSLRTLKDLARAFDVALLVRFIPFSSLINWTVDLKPNDIAPPSFEEEQQHLQRLILEATSSKGDINDIRVDTKGDDGYESKPVDRDKIINKNILVVPSTAIYCKELADVTT